MLELVHRLRQNSVQPILPVVGRNRSSYSPSELSLISAVLTTVLSAAPATVCVTTSIFVSIELVKNCVGVGTPASAELRYNRSCQWLDGVGRATHRLNGLDVSRVSTVLSAAASNCLRATPIFVSIELVKNCVGVGTPASAELNTTDLVSGWMESVELLTV